MKTDKTNGAKTHPKVDAFLARDRPWREEFKQLRAVVLSTGLSEEFKWGWPCYAHGGSNVVLIHGFKEYCAILFMKGVLLKDPQKVLIQQTPAVQTARQMRFTGLKDVAALKATLRAYILEAIAVEQSGVKPAHKGTSEFAVPEAFKKKLSQAPALKAAFQALTPGRQRGYLLYFAQAKQSKTVEARIEKCAPAILAGKGLNE